MQKSSDHRQQTFLDINGAKTLYPAPPRLQILFQLCLEHVIALQQTQVAIALDCGVLDPVVDQSYMNST